MEVSTFRDIIKLLLFPLALLYGLVIFIRNKLYDIKFFKSTRFEIPTISVGNLSVGGTGKSPHIEYLIELLHEDFNVAVLSRGYNRKSKGFKIANEQSTALDIGDEPRQFKKKFPKVTVTVGENRMLAIPDLLLYNPQTHLILLDDAFQHRAVRPGLSILLTEYDDLFTRDFILPVGRLREPAARYERADIIVISKCPADLTEEDRMRITTEIEPQRYQKIYFSTLKYRAPYLITDPVQRLSLQKDMDIVLFCGIAKTVSISQYLNGMCNRIFVKNHGDHHYYDRYDLENLKEMIANIDGKNVQVITTEKDAARLELHHKWIEQNQLKIYSLPVQVEFTAQDKLKFDEDIFKYVMLSSSKVRKY